MNSAVSFSFILDHDDVTNLMTNFEMLAEKSVSFDRFASKNVIPLPSSNKNNFF